MDSQIRLSWNRTSQQPAGCPGVGWERADSRIFECIGGSYVAR
jgi:hypothetical protein